AGHKITWCELPAVRHMIEPILHSRQIHLAGVAGRGCARLHEVTTDFGRALTENDLVLLIVPAYAHKPFAEACAPHLRPGQVLILMPGTLGSLEIAHLLRQ